MVFFYPRGIILQMLTHDGQQTKISYKSSHEPKKALENMEFLKSVSLIKHISQNQNEYTI